MVLPIVCHACGPRCMDLYWPAHSGQVGSGRLHYDRPVQERGRCNTALYDYHFALSCRHQLRVWNASVHEYLLLACPGEGQNLHSRLVSLLPQSPFTWPTASVKLPPQLSLQLLLCGRLCVLHVTPPSPTAQPNTASESWTATACTSQLQPSAGAGIFFGICCVINVVLWGLSGLLGFAVWGEVGLKPN